MEEIGQDAAPLIPRASFGSPVARSRRRFASVLAFSVVLLACRGDAPPSPDRVAPAATTSDTEAAGVRFVEILTGGASPSDSLPLVVGIHGLGSSPERFGLLLSSLSTPARLILPYGLDPYGEGFAWFPEWRDDAELAAGTQRAADRLAAMIDELVRRRPTRGKPIVAGFSQGGILSFALAVLHPESIRAAFPISGLLAQALWPNQWPAGREMPRVHASHGTADDRIAIADARATVRRLEAVGFSADLKEYPGVTHTTTPEMRRDLVRAMTQELHP
jgi:phospholipase/carboxylesterase